MATPEVDYTAAYREMCDFILSTFGAPKAIYHAAREKPVPDLESVFLDDIITHYDDDAPRLIYADWLEEKGANKRASFIRAQCEIANVENSIHKEPLQRSRFFQLKQEIDDLMQYQPVPLLLLTLLPNSSFRPYQFHRGFIHRINCTVDFWLENGAGLYKKIPTLNYVRLIDAVYFIRSTPHHRYAATLVDSYVWQRSRVNTAGRFGVLPALLFDCLKDGSYNRFALIENGVSRSYDSSEQAYQDLSQACLTFARNSQSV